LYYRVGRRRLYSPLRIRCEFVAVKGQNGQIAHLVLLYLLYAHSEPYSRCLLMTYEWAFFRQADLGKAPGSTIERKQMSTKTTLKRIALVAVSALGFGVMTAIAPANAAVTLSGITAGTPWSGRVNTAGRIPVTVSFAAGAAANDTITVGIRVTGAPTGSAAFAQATANAVGTPITVLAVTQDNTAGAGADGRAASAGNVATAQVGNVFNAAAAATITLNSDAVAARTSASVNFLFTPDKEGTYSFLMWVGGETWSASYYQTTATVTTVGAPTAITLTKYGSIPSVETSSSNGALIRVTMKDANGNATRLATGESLSITSSGTPNVTLSKTSLGTSDEATTAGRYDFRAYSGDGTQATDGTEVITVSGSGGLIPATTTVNTSVSLVATGANTVITALDLDDATGYKGTASDNDYTAAGGASHTIKATIAAAASATASTSFPILITEGLRTYSSVVTFAATKTTATVAVAGTPSTGVGVTVSSTATHAAADATTVAITYAVSAAADLAVEGQSTVLSATGGTNKFTVKATDQYGNGMQYVAVSVAVSGRNTVLSTSLGVTDANGLISYSLKDAGTTGTKDTITFSATVSGQTAGANVATVNYGTVTVSTVTVSGGSKAETVAGTTLTAISAGDNGPDAGAKAIKAVVKDANGNVLSGVPVTFAVDAGAIKKTAGVDYSTVYTNANGEATTYVLGWKAGKQTITATAGGVSGTDYFTWAATDATSARVLSGTVTGNIISYKVVDRFGNPVTGAAISLSRTGSGLFGNGASTQSLTTDKTGTADASFTGDATVVAELAATTQGYDAAGKIGTTAVTAATAGTTAGTGDTLAPAGVGKLELKVALGVDASTVAANAAADAAAEAIDAANAATDAANLAAEAADAATVAAEEARDAADAATAAVEELATQVATLMAALKAQITTLANTVAKIAKKVRA